MIEITRKDHIIEKLSILDILCERKNVRADLIVIGGSGMVILMEEFKKTFRPTRDIDIKIIDSTNERELVKILNEVDIHIVSGMVSDLPPIEDFRERPKFEVEAGFTNISVYVPTPELLACTKIFSKRPKDLLDLKESGILDICRNDVLLGLIDEYSPYMLNQDDLDINVHEIKKVLNSKTSTTE